MSERNANESPEMLMVPISVVMDLQEELEVELHQIVTRLPEMRAAIEAQWAEGTKAARVVSEKDDPINARLETIAAVLTQWMNQDYGEGMIKTYVLRMQSLSHHTDELVAVNITEPRRARLAEGAVDISESALRTALGYINQEKDRALDDQKWESAAVWRDNERNVEKALGGLGLAQPER